MTDIAGGAVGVVGPDQWDAIALWPRQHPRAPELLDALAVAAGNPLGQVNPASRPAISQRCLSATGRITAKSHAYVRPQRPIR